jgi:hypothetical protein
VGIFLLLSGDGRETMVECGMLLWSKEVAEFEGEARGV